MILYTIHNANTDIPVWTSPYKHEIVVYLTGEDLNKYYVKYTDESGSIKCSASDFIVCFNNKSKR